MTKQEKIQESYGINYRKHKDVIDENGWNQKRIFNHQELDYSKYEYEAVGHGIYISRPKELKGIENNNEWIKIESESDLPKDDIDCHYITKHNDKIISGCFRHKSYRGWVNMFTVDHFIAVGFGHVTHYQQIEKPKPPIY